jgi:outer membrane protein TolC
MRALLLAAALLAPEEENSLALSLDAALERARATSAALGRYQALRNAADASQRGAKAERLPQLDLSAGYTRIANLPELPFGSPGLGSEPFLPGSLGVLLAQASIVQPLYTGGGVGAGIDAAAARKQAAEADWSDAAAALTLETSSAYWALVSARARERVVAEAQATYEAHLKDARNRQAVGMAASNEVLAVQIERDRADLQRLQAENGAAQANANLLRLCGLPPGTRVLPTDQPLPDAPPSLEAESLVALALEGRKDVAALRARVAEADASQRVHQAGRRPRAALAAGYVYLATDGTQQPLFPGWSGAWTAGVQVSWSPFELRRSGAASAEAEARSQALRRQLEDLEQRVRLDVTTRILDHRTAHATHAVAQRALQAARENLRVTNDRYRQGVSSSSDLLDAEVALLRAGYDATDTAVSVRLSAAGLDRAVGR